MGYLVRTLISDIVDAYEINRKECAQVLININRWLATGVFIQPGQDLSKEEKIADGGNWQLESALIEVSSMIIFKLVVGLNLLDITFRSFQSPKSLYTTTLLFGFGL